MKRWSIGLVAGLLILLLLQTVALAYTPPEIGAEQTAEEVVAAYMESRGLHDGNFSMSYYNTVTGESFAFNDKSFMVAASTYKLPLNMYYYELEQAGELAPDAYISRAGMSLSDCHRLSLVWSDNDVSIGMLYNLGTFRQYKDCMKKYFTMPEEEIDYSYYVDNRYCTNMMMDALKYLYENRENFDEMLEYMQEAQPEQWFRTYVTDIPVAHKYGYFEGAINDTGIFYTEEPFLLAVYTQDTAETVVGEVAALMTAYNISHTTPEEPEPVHTELAITPTISPLPEEEPLEEPAALEEPAQVSEPEPRPQEPEVADAFSWWMIPVALGMFLLGGGLVLLIVRSGKSGGRYVRRWEEKMDEK